jgi:hypothetical protein
VNVEKLKIAVNDIPSLMNTFLCTIILQVLKLITPSLLFYGMEKLIWLDNDLPFLIMVVHLALLCIIVTVK